MGRDETEAVEPCQQLPDLIQNGKIAALRNRAANIVDQLIGGCRLLLKILEHARGERIQIMGLPGRRIEDDELIAPPAPDQTGRWRNPPEEFIVGHCGCPSMLESGRILGPRGYFSVISSIAVNNAVGLPQRSMPPIGFDGTGKDA